MGLWAWAKQHPFDVDAIIIFLDSEGLDTPGVPQHYNWLLSAVTLLLSYVFIYQSKGSIDSHATERLDLILRITEQLERKKTSDSRTAPNKAFYWLIRDHQ